MKLWNLLFALLLVATTGCGRQEPPITLKPSVPTPVKSDKALKDYPHTFSGKATTTVAPGVHMLGRLTPQRGIRCRYGRWFDPDRYGQV